MVAIKGTPTPLNKILCHAVLQAFLPKQVWRARLWVREEVDTVRPKRTFSKMLILSRRRCSRTDSTLASTTLRRRDTQFWETYSVETESNLGRRALRIAMSRLPFLIIKVKQMKIWTRMLLTTRHYSLQISINFSTTNNLVTLRSKWENWKQFSVNR